MSVTGSLSTLPGPKPARYWGDGDLNALRSGIVNVVGPVVEAVSSLSTGAPSGLTRLTGYATGNTTQGSTGTAPLSSFIMSGAGIASVGYSSGTVIVSVPAGGGVGDGGNVIAAGTSTAASTGTIVWANSNGVSFGLSGSTVTATVKTDYLTTAAASDHTHSQYLTTAQPPGAYLTTAQPVGAYLTTARASNDGVGLNTAGTAVTWTVNSGGISLNAGAYLTTAQPVGAYLTTARASNDALGLNTAQSNVTWTANSAGLSLDARGYAGTGTSATNASVTLNSNGLAVSVAAPGAAAAVNRKWYEIIPGDRLTTCCNITSASYSKRPIFLPFYMGGQVVPNTVLFVASRTAGTSLNMTYGAAIYSLSDNTKLNIITSTTNAISCVSSVSWSGIRNYYITGLGGATLSEGRYVVALYFSGSNNSTAVANLQLMGGDVTAAAGWVHPGTNSTAATATDSRFIPFWGVYTATTAGFPATVGLAEIAGGNAGLQADVYVVLREIAG